MRKALATGGPSLAPAMQQTTVAERAGQEPSFVGSSSSWLSCETDGTIEYGSLQFYLGDRRTANQERDYPWSGVVHGRAPYPPGPNTRLTLGGGEELGTGVCVAGPLPTARTPEL